MTQESIGASAFHSTALEDLGRRRKRLWIVFIGFLPFVLVLHLVVSDEISFVIAWILMSGFVVHASIWRCPQCGERAFYKALYNNMLSSKCLHCGLELSGADTVKSSAGS